MLPILKGIKYDKEEEAYFSSEAFAILQSGMNLPIEHGSGDDNSNDQSADYASDAPCSLRSQHTQGEAGVMTAGMQLRNRGLFDDPKPVVGLLDDPIPKPVGPFWASKLSEFKAKYGIVYEKYDEEKEAYLSSEAMSLLKTGLNIPIHGIGDDNNSNDQSADHASDALDFPSIVVDCCVNLGPPDLPPKKDNSGGRGGCQYCYGKLIHHPEGGCDKLLLGSEDDNN